MENLKIQKVKDKIFSIKVSISTNKENIKFSQNELKNNNFESESERIARENILKRHEKVLNENIKTLNALESLLINFENFSNKNIILASSSKSKLNEMKRILSHIETLENAKDLKEVDGNIDEIIIHKAKDARIENNIDDDSIVIVEDTIIRDLDNNIDITDIKWDQETKLSEGMNVEWITSLALNDGDNIYIFRGKITGIITMEREKFGYAFDPYFIPIEKNGHSINKENKTLAELERDGIKDLSSARALALENFSKFYMEKAISINEILPWEGKYQNEIEEVEVSNLDM